MIGNQELQVGVQWSKWWGVSRDTRTILLGIHWCSPPLGHTRIPNRGLFFFLSYLHPKPLAALAFSAPMYLSLDVSQSRLGCIVSSFWQPRPSASLHSLFLLSLHSVLFNNKFIYNNKNATLTFPPSLSSFPVLLLPTIHPKKEIHKLY